MYIKVDRMKPLGALYPAARINPHPKRPSGDDVRFPLCVRVDGAAPACYLGGFTVSVWAHGRALPVVMNAL